MLLHALEFDSYRDGAQVSAAFPTLVEMETSAAEKCNLAVLRR